MNRAALAIVILLLVLPAFAAERRPATASTITILSLIPGQAEPGKTVTLEGSGFTSSLSLFLSNRQIPSVTIDDHFISFEVPPVESGTYTLYIRRADGSVSRSYAFTVLPLKPEVISLSPEQVDLCSDRERSVTVTGRNFTPGALLLLNGAIIRSKRTSAESITFVIPPNLPAGMHQLQVKNPSDALSTPLALAIDSQPAIEEVSRGTDQVTTYELRIRGRNFQRGFQLLVNDTPVTSNSVDPQSREQLIQKDCRNIIYVRHPYDSTEKPLTLQIVNPGGATSPPYNLSAP